MGDDYRAIFERRGGAYNEAHRRWPHARVRERELLLDRLELKPGYTVCDLPAGGGYLADGLHALGVPGERLICVEPSAAFAAGIPVAYRRVVGALTRLPLADACCDRAASLAGIHHLAEKAALFAEVYRILRPAGRFAVADVRRGSDVAAFLDGAVDRYSETGHRGLFLGAGELTDLLRGAGFRDIEESPRDFGWDFADRAAMVAFCRELFGMVRASEGEVAAAIDAQLRVSEGDQGVTLHWSLVYASGAKG